MMNYGCKKWSVQTLYSVLLLQCLSMQHDVPSLRAPTGCPIPPPPLPQPRFRRSFTLSQQDATLTPQLVNGLRLGGLTQDCAFSEPRRFERTLTMPPKVHKPLQMNVSRLPLTDNGPALTAGTSQPKLSAFKQVPPQSHLVSPQRQTSSKLLPDNGHEPFSLICDRSDIKLSALSSDELRIVCCQLSSPNCTVKKLE